MTPANREQRLVEAMARQDCDRLECLNRINYRRKRSQLGVVIGDLAWMDVTKGMHAFYVQHDVAALKQSFYNACRLMLAMLGQTDDSVFDTYNGFLVALLSDNEEVIKAMACVTTKALHESAVNPLYFQYQVHMLQLAMRGEDELLRTNLDKLAKHGKNPLRKEAAAGQDFYTLLLNRDQSALENLIQEKHAKINSQSPWFEDFMSMQAVVETKLCWRRGMEIQIDSPLVPMELMPVRPLPQYDKVYDFLEPGWKPPIQGVIGKAVRWLTQK